MKTTPLLAALVALATLGTAAAPIAGNDPADILTPAQDPPPTCRSLAAPVHLFVVVQHDGDQMPVGQALWRAGMPAGSTARFYWDHDAPRALDRAERSAEASGTAPTLAPEGPWDAWAATLLPPC